MIPYENLTFSPRVNAREIASKVIQHGWESDAQPPLLINGAIPWAFSGHDKRSWNFQIHCWAMLNSLLRASSESDDDDFLVLALRVAKDWIENHPSASVKPDMSRFAWYDMAVGLRAYRLAYLFDAADARGLLEEPDRSLFWSSLEDHARYLADDANISFDSNHGYYQIAGQLIMGRRLADRSPIMAHALKQGRARLKVMLDRQFARDGVHREHSPGYHRMVYGTLKKLIDIGIVDAPDIIDFARRIEEALSWFVLPNQHLVNFGDTDYHALARKPALAIRDWVTPEMRFWVSGGKVGKPSSETCRAFRDGGYFVARKPGENIVDFGSYSYFALNAAFHSRMHKHADDLSFVWYDRGENILVDSGRYGYIGKTKLGSKLWRDGHWYTNPWRVYCESTRAHNTLEFDGRNLPRNWKSLHESTLRRLGALGKSIAKLIRLDKPYGSALQRWGEDVSGLVFVEAECKHFGSIRRIRLIFFMPRQWLIVFDWFQDSSDKPHMVKQWFHVGHELQVCLDREQYLISRRGDQPLLRVASLLSEPSPSRPYFGEEEPMIQGWWSPKLRTVSPNYAFCYELSGASCGAYATLFSFSDQLQTDVTRSNVNAAGRKGQFYWEDESGIHQLQFQRPVVGDLLVNYNLRAR